MLLRRSIRHLHSLKFPSHTNVNVNILSNKNLLRVGFSPAIRSFSASSNSNINGDIVDTTTSTSLPLDTATSSIDGISTDIATSLAESGVVEATTDAVVQVAAWGPAAKVMYAIDYIHTYLYIPYWESIILVSLGVRFFLIPIAIKTAQNAARLAFIRPHLDKLQKAHAANPNAASDPIQAKQYQLDMTALFVKYKVNPLMSILLPFLQLPIFISFFTALKDMGTYYPGFYTGGAFWFTNLAVADTTMILPILNGLSFLAMVEVGADGMPQNEQKDTFKMAMRAMAVAIVPLTMGMPQALFVYWNFNNLFSLGQAMIFKTGWFREKFNVPAPPKPEDTPPLKLHNPFAKIAEYISKEYHEASGKAKPTIVDGSGSIPFESLSSSSMSPPPPPPPSDSISSSNSNSKSGVGNDVIHAKATAAGVSSKSTTASNVPLPPVTYALPTMKRNKVSTAAATTSSSVTGDSIKTKK